MIGRLLPFGVLALLALLLLARLRLDPGRHKHLGPLTRDDWELTLRPIVRRLAAEQSR